MGSLPKIKILVFGTGGVGCVYGYLCYKGGAEVVALCRTNYDAVKSNGIQIRSAIWGRCHFRPHVVRTVVEATTYGPFDYILVCTKALPGVVGQIKDAVTPSSTAIVLAQNGIGVEQDYANLYPINAIISGVIYLPVTQTEPGIVEHGPLEHFDIGTYPASASLQAKAQAKRFSDLFQAGGGSCPLYEDIQPEKWVKVGVNAAWNPTTALTMCDDANFLRSSPGAEAMVRKIMREVGRVATAAGFPNAITEETIERDLQRPKSRLLTGGKEPSMLTDVREGRPLEVEAIIGNTMRIGQTYGVETPYLELLYTLAQGRNYALQPDERWKPIARHD